MSFQKTQERWELFLTKIEETFDALMEKAQVALIPLFEQTDMEITTFQNAWRGISIQASNLIYKIDETWEDKVEDTFLGKDLDYESAEFIAERMKGYQLRHSLENSLKVNEIELFAKAAKRLFEVAKDILAKDFCCSQCKASLSIKDNFFRSYYVTCDYCQTVNTFEPGTKVRNLEHFGVDALAKEAALPNELKYDEALFKNYALDQEVYSKEQLLELYKNQVVDYLEKRVEIIPDYQERYEKDLEAKLEFLKKYN